MTNLLNRVEMTTATTGTGTITLGAAIFDALTLDEAGAANATQYPYLLEDGNDFEYGYGTYTASGTTFSRDTVTKSKIGGTAGTSKINLSGSARIRIVVLAADIVTPTGTQTLSNKTHDGATLPVTYSDNGAGEGPVTNLLRNSASPAASDLIGGVAFQGKDSAANTETYAKILAEIIDATSTSEDARINWQTVIAGALATRLQLGHGLYTPSVTGGDKGANTANIGTIYQSNVPVLTSIALQAFTASGTYTPTSGMKYCIVFCTGAGGGGGGADASDSDAAPAAGGGGSSPTTVQIYSASTIGATQTVTIGGAGSGGSNTGTSGTGGGTTSFGSLLVVTGGSGGGGSATGNINTIAFGGDAGSASTPGLVTFGGMRGKGAMGGQSNSGPSNFGLGGDGGASFWGPGGFGAVNAASNGAQAVTGAAYGAGGGGASAVNFTTGNTGGNGAGGFILILEFI